MREIFFRGRTTKGVEWVSGFYAEYSTAPFIGTPNPQGTMLWFEVDPETVGQFTGLTDRNGKRIFEGDIVLFKWDELHDYCRVIEFDDGEFCAKPVRPMEGIWTIRICGENKKISVIGNIHDNPELLEVGE